MTDQLPVGVRIAPDRAAGQMEFVFMTLDRVFVNKENVLLFYNY